MFVRFFITLLLLSLPFSASAQLESENNNKGSFDEEVQQLLRLYDLLLVPGVVEADIFVPGFVEPDIICDNDNDEFLCGTKCCHNEQLCDEVDGELACLDIIVPGFVELDTF